MDVNITNGVGFLTQSLGASQGIFLSFIEGDEETYRLEARGNWAIENAKEIFSAISNLGTLSRKAFIINFSGLEGLDTTGAVLVRRLTKNLGVYGLVMREGLTPSQENLLALVENKFKRVTAVEDEEAWYFKMLADVGVATETVVSGVGRILSFVGQVLGASLRAIVNPSRIRWTALVKQMELVGLTSLGIVGLISFLIGGVIVNQGALQLAKFGADILVIDMLGIGHLRELGILLTAIIVAGRSGSSFTAQIGSMKLNEEIDAMVTMGMNPIDVLVLPRLFALVLCLPLLAFYSDIVGLAGGALMAWVQLDIAPTTFVSYLQTAISFDHYMVGITKAPFFAAVIAISGCYQGLNVHGSADSLGLCTTKSVVQSIFLVIVLDAFFAIFFTALDI